MKSPTLRIIAGHWRSRRIVAPPPQTTRPMIDRVKEAVFDILGSRLGMPGSLPQVAVLDLFAGSGAMGLEAVSRGATSCVFAERSKPAVRILRANIDSLADGDSLKILAVDVWRCPISAFLSAGGPFQIVFVDPPYDDARDTSPQAKLSSLLDRIMGSPAVMPESVGVVHHERKVRLEPTDEQAWMVVMRREYGTSAITLVGPATSSASPERAPTQQPEEIDGEA